MVYVRAPYMSYMSYYDKYDIWHLACIYISIWVSKEALEPRNAANHLRYPTKLFLGPKK